MNIIISHRRFSGFKTKDTDEWHLIRRTVSSDGDIWESMMNNGDYNGLQRIFFTSGHVWTRFYEYGWNRL